MPQYDKDCELGDFCLSYWKVCEAILKRKHQLATASHSEELIDMAKKYTTPETVFYFVGVSPDFRTGEYERYESLGEAIEASKAFVDDVGEDAAVFEARIIGRAVNETVYRAE